MFSILRFIVIVGVIFYYSPVRQRGDDPTLAQDFLSSNTAGRMASASDGAPGRLETMWQALPEGAKQAVVDRIVATSGLTPAAPKPSDTLKPEDRAPSSHQPRG